MSEISSIFALMDKHAPTTVTGRIGLTPERVRQLTAPARSALAMTPGEIRRANALFALSRRPKGCWRGIALPEHVVLSMYIDYLQVGSTYKVAALYGRSQSDIMHLFNHRGLALNQPKAAPVRIHNGITYHRDGERTYRRTVMVDGRRVISFLHRQIWEDHNGRPVPAGHQITFRDDDRENLEPSNLVCLTKSEVCSLNRRRALARRSAA